MEPATPKDEAESRSNTAPPAPPPICGDFDMRIDRNGTWYYRNSPIGRLALAKLFASVLRRDDQGGYWLTTPVENGRIVVEDVPFVAVELMSEGEGRARVIRFRTNLDDVVAVDSDHPLRMGPAGEEGDAAPYVLIRRNLEARLVRSVYYHLVELCEPSPDHADVLGIWSSGQFYPIGTSGSPDSR
jgi:hypothetical protein